MRKNLARSCFLIETPLDTRFRFINLAISMVEVPAQALLREFLEARKGALTQAQAAKQLDTSGAALIYYLDGVSRPKSALRERIERWSGGAVPASAWLTDAERAELEQQTIAPDPVVAESSSDSGEHAAPESPNGPKAAE